MNELKPGQEIKISGDQKCWVTAERTCNGKIIRYVRHTPDGFIVFKTVAA